MGVVSIGVTAGSSAGVTVTSNASADTYSSSFTTLRSAGTYPAMDQIFINARVVTGTGRKFVLALYQGASDTLFAEIPFQLGTTSKTEDLPPLHVHIPADVAIKAKLKDNVGSGAIMVSVAGQEDTAFVTTGAASIDLLTLSAGPVIEVALDTGGTANTDVSVDLATTAADYNCFYVRIRDTSSSNVADAVWQLLDDSTVIATRIYKRLTNNDANVVWFGPIYVESVVASGSVMKLEGRSSSTTINDMNFSLLAANVPTPSAGSSLVATEDDVQYDIRPLSGASQILQVQLVDTAGDAKTGLTYSGVTCYLSVDGAAPTAQTLVDATVGAYTSLGFKEISSANMPGAYMFCPATLPSSGKRATYRFTASGTRPAILHVDLVASDPRAAAITTSDIVAAEILALDGLTNGDTAVDINGVAFTATRAARNAIATLTAD